MTTYSNWKEDLIEVIDTPTTEKKAEKKIKETKVNNKIVINPTMKEAVAKMGGELLEVKEVDDKKDTAGTKEDPQIKSKEKRAGMIKRQVLLKKLQAVRAGGGTDITAGYEPEGDQLDERLGGKGYKPYTSLTGKKVSGDWEDSDRGAGNKAKKRAGGKVEKKSPTYLAHVHNKEGYEAKKTGEVLAAFKRDPKVRKRFEKAAKKEDGPGSVKNRAADSMLQTAKDTAKRKGDTSKSDDRYAYEEVQLEAKVDKGRSDYGKASIRNYRRSGPGHGEPAMFDPENKRGKTIDKRREEHKERRGKKGAKVPAYKVEETQVDEATRLKKEKGYDKGGTKKPSGKPTALSVVLDKIKKEHGAGAVMGQGGSRQKKKEKGAKSSSGTGKYLKRAQDKKAYVAKAKKAGFKSAKDYTNTVARYGSEDNYKKGKGLGT